MLPLTVAVTLSRASAVPSGMNGVDEASPSLPISEGLVGVRVMTGVTVTVMVAAFESADPAALLTRTQYVVVEVKAGVVKLADVAPETGDDVTPDAPMYH